MTDQTLPAWRPPGARNYIRVGDVVRVLPTPGKRDGFEARVLEIHQDWEDGPVVFQVVGGARGKVHTRFIRAERIRRVAQYRTNEVTGRKDRRERKR